LPVGTRCNALITSSLVAILFNNNNIIQRY
jgi:hypothetical protein